MSVRQSSPILINYDVTKCGTSKRESAISLNNYAVKLMACGELSKAEGHLQQSLEQVISTTTSESSISEIELCPPSHISHAQHQGEYDEGMDRFSQPLSIPSGQMHGNDQCAVVATIVYNKGLLYLRQNRYKEAEGSFYSALNQVQQNTTGSDETYSNLVQILQNIGFVQYKSGSFQDALTSYAQAFQLLSNYRSIVNDPACMSSCMLDIAAILNCLGVVSSKLHSDNKSAKAQAVEAFTESLAIRREIFGKDQDDKDIATTLNNLGRVYFQNGDQNKALGLYSEALSMRIRLFGNEHLDVAASSFNVGQAQHGLGNFVEALKNYQAFTSIVAKLLGDFHYNLTIGLKGIAEIQLKQKNFNEAMKMYRQALSVEKDGEEICLISGKMADVFYEKGDLDEAIRAYKETLDLQCEVHGFISLNAVETLRKMSHIRKLRGEYDCCVRLLETAVDIQRKLLGQFDPNVSSTLSSIALICYETRNYKKALKVYQDVLQIQRQVFGHNHAHPAGTLRSIGHLFFYTKHYDMAARVFTESLKVYRALDSPNDIAGVLSNLGSIYWNLGDYEKCIMFYSEALSTMQCVLGCTRHMKLIPILKQLGNIYRSRGMLQEAIQCFTEVIEVYKMNCKQNGSEIAQILNEIANVHMQSGQTNEMMSCFSEASRHLRTLGKVVYDLPISDFNFYHISKMNLECSAAA